MSFGLTALIPAITGYLGAKKQADAAEANSQAQYQLQKDAQDYYKSIVGPGIGIAQDALLSGAPQAAVLNQQKAANFAGGLGEYYGGQAIGNYEAGQNLSDFAISENAKLAGLTPEQQQAQQLQLAQGYQNPYTQQVTNAGLGAIQSDYDTRAKNMAGSLVGRGQFGSTIAGNNQASLEAQRAGAIGNYVAGQNQAAYNQSLSQAQGLQGTVQGITGNAVNQLGQYGQGKIGLGQDQGQAAVNYGELSGKIGLEAIYAPAQSYLGTVQSPVAGTPTISNAPQQSNISPLAVGLGTGISAYNQYLNK